jgi:hypothetical protein
MTDAAIAAERPFRVGPVFSRAWSVLLSDFPKFFVIGLVLALPDVLSDSQDLTIFDMRVSVIATVVLGGLGDAMILTGALQILRGRPFQLREGVRKTLSSFWPIIGISILWLLVLLSLLILSELADPLAVSSLGLVGILLGFVLVIAALFVLISRWPLAIPACVAEGLGLFASLKRSAQLTKGHSWKVLGIFVLALIPIMVLPVIVRALTGLLTDLAPAMILASSLSILANLLVTALANAFVSLVIAMVDHDLRVGKEGVDTEHIAAVFY